METIYLVKYSSGSYDDYTEKIVFATTDKKKATKWVTKFNRIKKEYLKMYEPYLETKHSFLWIKYEYADKYFNKWHKLSKINRAFWEEIEVR